MKIIIVEDFAIKLFTPPDPMFSTKILSEPEHTSMLELRIFEDYQWKSPKILSKISK